MAPQRAVVHRSRHRTTSLRRPGGVASAWPVSTPDAKPGGGPVRTSAACEDLRPPEGGRGPAARGGGRAPTRPRLHGARELGAPFARAPARRPSSGPCLPLTTKPSGAAIGAYPAPSRSRAISGAPLPKGAAHLGVRRGSPPQARRQRLSQVHSGGQERSGAGPCRGSCGCRRASSARTAKPNTGAPATMSSAPANGAVAGSLGGRPRRRARRRSRRRRRGPRPRCSPRATRTRRSPSWHAFPPARLRRPGQFRFHEHLHATTREPLHGRARGGSTGRDRDCRRVTMAISEERLRETRHRRRRTLTHGPPRTRPRERGRSSSAAASSAPPSPCIWPGWAGQTPSSSSAAGSRAARAGTPPAS